MIFHAFPASWHACGTVLRKASQVAFVLGPLPEFARLWLFTCSRIACWQLLARTPAHPFCAGPLLEGLPLSAKARTQPVKGMSGEERSRKGVVVRKNVCSICAVGGEEAGLAFSTTAVESVQVELVPSSGGWKPAKVMEPVAL